MSLQEDGIDDLESLRSVVDSIVAKLCVNESGDSLSLAKKGQELASADESEDGEDSSDEDEESSSDSEIDRIDSDAGDQDCPPKNFQNQEKASDVGVYVRTDNELLPQEVELQPLPTDVSLNDQIELCGRVVSLSETSQALIVEALGSSGSTPNSISDVLDHDSVLCTQDRRLVGRVEEIFGPVIRPFYRVRLMGEFAIDFSDKSPSEPAKNESVLESGKEEAPNVKSTLENVLVSQPVERLSGIAVCEKDPGISSSLKTNSQTIAGADLAKKLLCSGSQLYVLKKHGSHINPSTVDVRGSDASNMHDEEVGEGELDFSDDEAEAAARAQMNMKRRQNAPVRLEIKAGNNRPKRKQRRQGPGVQENNPNRFATNSVSNRFAFKNSTAMPPPPMMPVYPPSYMLPGAPIDVYKNQQWNPMGIVPQGLPPGDPRSAVPQQGYLPPLTMIPPPSAPPPGMYPNPQYQSNQPSNVQQSPPLYYQYWHATQKR